MVEGRKDVLQHEEDARAVPLFLRVSEHRSAVADVLAQVPRLPKPAPSLILPPEPGGSGERWGDPGGLREHPVKLRTLMQVILNGKRPPKLASEEAIFV